jgi:hypothetical protein
VRCLRALPITVWFWLRAASGYLQASEFINRVQITAFIDHVDNYETKMIDMDQERWLPPVNN